MNPTIKIHSRNPVGLHGNRHFLGMTLIEAMATMAVLAAGIAGVANMTSFLSGRMAYNSGYVTASAIAEQVLDEVRNYGCAPNATIDACERIRTHYMDDDNGNNPKMFCVEATGTPVEMDAIAGANTCSGFVYRADILVTTPDNEAPNEVGWDRKRIAGGVDEGQSLILDNVANIRVSVRWNDVKADGTFIEGKRPMFVVYQTRVTQ